MVAEDYTSRLPLELLDAVLNVSTHADVVRVARVSRHWRAAALTHPDFFRTLHFNGNVADIGLWANKMLEASIDTTPLSISAYPQGSLNVYYDSTVDVEHLLARSRRVSAKQNTSPSSYFTPAWMFSNKSCGHFANTRRLYFGRHHSATRPQWSVPLIGLSTSSRGAHRCSGRSACGG
jgi:hypothetical protein